MSEHTVLLATQRQMQGLIDERDALSAALAGKQQQIAGLVEERDTLKAENDEMRRAVAAAQGEARKWRRAFSGEENVV